MTEPNLKKCPFCGGEVKYSFYAGNPNTGESDTYRIRCLKCGASVYSSNSGEEIIKAWNWRCEEPRSLTPERKRFIIALYNKYAVVLSNPLEMTKDRIAAREATEAIAGMCKALGYDLIIQNRQAKGLKKSRGGNQ